MDKEATLKRTNFTNLFKIANEKFSNDIESSLFGKRFNRSTLKSILQRLLGTKKVTLKSKAKDDYVGEEDYCICFSSANGSGTIYYLKARNQQMYIVKVKAYLILEENFHAMEILGYLTMKHLVNNEFGYHFIFEKIKEYYASGELLDREYLYLLDEWKKVVKTMKSKKESSDYQFFNYGEN